MTRVTAAAWGRCLAASALFSLSLLSCTAEAAVTKCSSPDGETVYTNVDCPVGFVPVAEGSTAPSPPVAGAGSVPSEGPVFLWAVAGQKNTVYLLGSLHLARRPDLYPLGPEIEKAYRTSSTVVFEANLDEVNSPGYQERLARTGIYRDGTTLKDHLSPGTMELLAARIREAGLSRDTILRLRPWLCALTLTAATLQQMGFDPRYGLDRHFLERSGRDGKARVFLESAEFQMSLLTELDGLLQEEFLERTLRELDLVEGLYAELLGAWKGGDAGMVGSLLRRSFEQYPQIYDRFVLRRNGQWLGRLEGLLASDGDVLVVVGAGHLPGRGGLIDRLRERGYAVTQK